jgi:hypothetical protein
MSSAALLFSVIPETAQWLSGIQMRIRMLLDSGFACAPE